MTINRAAIEADEVARAHESLWRVERTFRETKSTLEVRPIFHHREDTTIGHIVGCSRALRLEMNLQRRLEQREPVVRRQSCRRGEPQEQARQPVVILVVSTCPHHKRDWSQGDQR